MIVEWRIEDIKRICNMLGLSPPPGFDYIDLWKAITKGKKMPAHPNAPIQELVDAIIGKSNTGVRLGLRNQTYTL